MAGDRWNSGAGCTTPSRKTAGPRDVAILLCKLPPRDLDALTGLRLIQLSSVGYEQLRHLGLSDKPLHVCNARGLYDCGIAEWNLAMILGLGRDLRGLIRHQEGFLLVLDLDRIFSALASLNGEGA